VRALPGRATASQSTHSARPSIRRSPTEATKACEDGERTDYPFNLLSAMARCHQRESHGVSIGSMGGEKSWINDASITTQASPLRATPAITNLKRAQIDLDAAILRATCSGIVAGDRLARSGTVRGDT